MRRRVYELLMMGCHGLKTLDGLEVRDVKAVRDSVWTRLVETGLVQAEEEAEVPQKDAVGDERHDEAEKVLEAVDTLSTGVAQLGLNEKEPPREAAPGHVEQPVEQPVERPPTPKRDEAWPAEDSFA
jgi:hypothetical protein